MRNLLVFVFLLAVSFSCFAEEGYGPAPLIEGKRPLVTWMDRFQGITQKPFTYYTPYGDIERNATMTDVMDALGIPLSISTSENLETWKYKFGDDQQIYVCFVNSRVVDVTDQDN